MTHETSFSDMRHGEGRDKVVNSNASIVHFNKTGGGGRSIGETFLMIKVTGLTPSAIEGLAQASVKAVTAANKGK